MQSTEPITARTGRTRRLSLNNRWLYLWLASFTLLALLPGTPLTRPVPRGDAGVYLYVGRGILEGRLPYVDIWDHKPPLILYLNALGLWLGQQSSWGIWLLALGALLLAVWCSVRLLRDAFQPRAAALGVALWLVTAGVLLSHGNRPELFAMLCQWGALLLFWQAWQRPSRKRLLLVGALGGVAALAKYNLVALWPALALVWFLGHGRRRSTEDRVSDVLVMFIGGIGLLFLVLLGLAWQGTLPAMLDATIRFNFFYAQANVVGRLAALERGLFLTTFVGLLPIALLGIIAARWRRTLHPLVLVALIELPFTVLLTTLPGNAPAHYYLTWLPSLTLLAASAIAATRPRKWQPYQLRLFRLGLLVTYILGSGNAFRLIYLQERQIQDDPRSVLITFLQEHSDDNTAILTWNTHANMPAILVAAERRTVGHYIYQHPLFNPGYTDDEQLFAELTLIQNQFPVWIIDRWEPVDGAHPDFGRKLFWQWGQGHNQLPSPPLRTVMDNFSQAYQPVTILAGRWIIYERVTPTQIAEYLED